MGIEEYERTAAPVDYTPRPRASQEVAAAKRQRQVETATETAAPTVNMPIAIGIGAVILLMIGMAIFSRTPTHPIVAPVATSAPAFAPPTMAPPTPTIPTFIARAYAAPDGVVLGPVDLDGEVVTAVARAGASWVQLERSDHTRIWFKRGDLPANLAVADTLPDLSPPTPLPQTGRGLTIVEDTPTAELPTEATLAEPTATTVWATAAPVVKAPDFKQPSTSATCKLIGCLGNNAVQSEHEKACHALYWQYGNSDDISEPDATAVRGCVWEGLYK